MGFFLLLALVEFVLEPISIFFKLNTKLQYVLLRFMACAILFLLAIPMSTKVSFKAFSSLKMKPNDDLFTKERLLFTQYSHIIQFKLTYNDSSYF